MGTDVQASGKTILWRSENENSKINAHADVFKHFGGPGGNGPTKLGAGVGYEHTPSGKIHGFINFVHWIISGMET